MPKVLIIDFFPHQCLGGGQKYSSALIGIFAKFNFKIIEICFWNTNIYKNKLNNSTEQMCLFGYEKKYENNIQEYLYKIWILIRAKKYFKKYLEKNDFDVIIDNCTCVSLPRKYKNKIIFIQHMDEKILFSWKREIIRRFFFIKSSFSNSEYNIVFTENNKKMFTKYLKNDNCVIIPLFVDVNKHYVENEYYDKHITYIGRTDSKQKNLNLLCEVSTLLENKIKVVGNNSAFIKTVFDKIEYCGEMTTHEIFNKILPNTKAIILTSDSEGLPFVVLEAYSCGVPVIIRDTFTNAKYLTNENRGILISREKNAVEIAEIINSIDWGIFNKETIIEFVEKNFSYNNFENKWTTVIEKMIKN